jgi:hypothetical protein
MSTDEFRPVRANFGGEISTYGSARDDRIPFIPIQVLIARGELNLIAASRSQDWLPIHDVKLRRGGTEA